jgi:hypothetical protein
MTNSKKVLAGVGILGILGLFSSADSNTKLPATTDNIAPAVQQVKPAVQQEAQKLNTAPKVEAVTNSTPSDTSAPSGPYVPPSEITHEQECPITTCNDGSCSSSTGRGTCSHHDGVRHY